MQGLPDLKNYKMSNSQKFFNIFTVGCFNFLYQWEVFWLSNTVSLSNQLIKSFANLHNKWLHNKKIHVQPIPS